MKAGLALILYIISWIGLVQSVPAAPDRGRAVYVLPVRGDINSSMVYLVRRGVKEAMDADAELLILDIDTNGGGVQQTIDIIEILNKFKGATASYVNKKAFSAGAFICFGTQKIYMAPEGVIGAAAVVVGSPDGGTQAMPDTVEVKAASAVSALIRVSAEKNGHNAEVADAMVKKTKELKIDGKVLNEKGQILTLTAREAEEKFGNPPKPLLSAGTIASLDELITSRGFDAADRRDIKPTGMEKFGAWLNKIAPLLLIVGVLGIYIEFKTPGFGLPGIVGISAFALYFLGGYAAGLSGAEWVLVFLLGLALVAVELFVYPGTVIIGIAGTVLMLAAIIMAMVDLYPGPGPSKLPSLPSLNEFQLPMQNLLFATIGAGIGVWIISRYLPKTSIYRAVVSSSASGMKTEAKFEQSKQARKGQVGVTVSALRPGGKAQFGDEILDVISQGEMLPKGTAVRIIGFSGTEALIEALEKR